MKMQAIVKNIRPTIHILKEDLKDLARSNRGEKELNERERTALADLRKNGYAVLQHYWSRKNALEMRDRLEAYLKERKNKDFESGAYIRFWDDRHYDEGVSRLYHVERLIPELKALREDASISRIIRAYYGVPFHSGVFVFQHNTKSNANTRYHHVDGFSKEFKSFMYLDDVDKGNGPFTYIRGTHRNHFVRIKKQLVGNEKGSPTSFYDQDLKSLLKQETPVCGPAGTLILADVRGFHRGSPQIDRSRSVLVNYLFKHPGDVYLDR